MGSNNLTLNDILLPLLRVKPSYPLIIKKVFKYLDYFSRAKSSVFCTGRAKTLVLSKRGIWWFVCSGKIRIILSLKKRKKKPTRTTFLSPCFLYHTSINNKVGWRFGGDLIFLYFIQSLNSVFL